MGREEELGTLVGVSDQMRRRRIRKRPDDHAGVVLISGHSGSGKSALVSELIHRLEQKHPEDYDVSSRKVLYCSGKFNQTKSEEPYFALRQALEELCDSILNLSDRAEILSCLKEQIGKEARILADAVPAIATLLGDDFDAVTLDSQDSLSSFNRLKYLFQIFVRTICKRHQVIMFIDDLQFSDGSTLEIIESILADSSEPKHLLFIGAYRSEDSELANNPQLVKLLDYLRGFVGKVTRIDLKPLSEDSVNEILINLLKLEEDETIPLAKVVHRKTHGNPFIVLEFLQKIVNERHLVYSLATYKWVVNIDSIKAQTFLAESIVSVVATRLRLLPPDVLKVMSLCACLWSKFDIDWLMIVLRGMDGYDGLPVYDSSSHLEDALHVAVTEDLLEDLGAGSFKFSHDRIQQSVYSFLDDRASQFHYHLGSFLKRHLDDDSTTLEFRKRFSFLAVDQLNLGSQNIKTKDEKIELAQMNLSAGKQAISLSAFFPAWRYLMSGIDLLEGDKWREYYDISLELFTNAVDMATCLGYFESCSILADEALENAKTIREKGPIFVSRVSSLGQQERFVDAMALSRSVLSELREPIPKKASIVHVLISVVKTGHFLKDKSDEDILSLPRNTDETKVTAMKLFSLNGVHTLMANRTNDMLLSLVRSNLVTMRNGLSKLSPSALSFYAIVVSSLGNIDEGNRLCKLAIRMLSHLDAFEYEADVIHNYGTFIHHWRSPYTECMKSLLQGYKSGMKHGDIEFAFYSSICSVIMFYQAGLPLQPAEKDCRSYCKQMVEYGRENNFSIARPTWQLLLNLSGRSTDPLILTGEAMDEEEFVRNETSRNNKGALQVYWANKGQLAYHFGDYDEAERVFTKFERTKANLATHILVSIHGYFYALTVLALARATKKRKYKGAARKAIKQVRLWVDNGSINHTHKLILLNAEYEALSCRDPQKVRISYDSAIVAASRAGFANDAAIASERAGICLLELGDNYWAAEYLSRSFRLYAEWGAVGVSKHLLSKYSTVLEVVEADGSEILSATTLDSSAKSSTLDASTPYDRRRSTYHHGVEQYDPSSAEKHGSLGSEAVFSPSTPLRKNGSSDSDLDESSSPSTNEVAQG